MLCDLLNLMVTNMSIVGVSPLQSGWHESSYYHYFNAYVFVALPLRTTGQLFVLCCSQLRSETHRRFMLIFEATSKRSNQLHC